MSRLNLRTPPSALWSVFTLCFQGSNRIPGFLLFFWGQGTCAQSLSPIAYGKLNAPFLLMKIAVDFLSLKLKTENAKVQVWFYAIVCIPLFKMKSNCIFLVWIAVNKTWVSFVLLGEAQQWWESLLVGRSLKVQEVIELWVQHHHLLNNEADDFWKHPVLPRWAWE